MGTSDIVSWSCCLCGGGDDDGGWSLSSYQDNNWAFQWWVEVKTQLNCREKYEPRYYYSRELLTL
ncbi:hypothetical protein Hanom_Chr10g00920041 [Helianthus anomalus]